MGKCKDPKVLAMDLCFEGTPEAQELLDKGHIIVWLDMKEWDLVISPKAQMTPLGRIGYVVKKLKEIVKEVAG